MKLNKAFITLFAIVLATATLIYLSYEAGYKKSQNNFGPLTMMINIDSNFVTTGIYESLPNNVKKTMQFSTEGSPSIVNNVKLFAEIKYITVGGEEINVDDGKIWNYIKRENIYQRQLKSDDEEKNEKESKKDIKGSNLALLSNN